MNIKERKAIIYYDPNFRDAHAHETVKLMPSVLENLEYADLVKGSEDGSGADGRRVDIFEHK